MKFFVRQSRQTASSQRKPIKLQIDHLEDRLTPSGFGPADGAYIVEPWNGGYRDVQIQPTDQKIVAAGVSSVPSSYALAVARYDSQGNTDSAYGSNGVATSSLGSILAQGDSLVLQSDGKAVVTGICTVPLPTGSEQFVARLTSTGSFDTTYGSGGFTRVDFNPNDGGAAYLVSAAGLQSTGKAVIASMTTGSAVVARFTTGGSLDTGKSGFGTVVHNQAIGYTLSSFGGSTNIFSDVAIQQDDKVVALGVSANGSTGGFLLARYTANGVLDTTFNGTGFTTLLPAGATSARSYGIAIQGDGKIVTVGTCTGIDGGNDMLISRFNTNGALDTSFGGGKGYVQLDIDGTASQTTEVGRDVVIQGDGKIVAVGNEYAGDGSVAMPASVLVARFNPDGTPDSTFGSAGFKLSAPAAGQTFESLLQGVALESNGNIIVAGTDNDGTNNHPMLMRFFGTTTSPLGPVGNPASPSNNSGLRFADLAGTNAPGLIGIGNNTPSQGATGGSSASVNPLAATSYQHRQQAASGIQAKSLSLGARHTSIQTADAAFLTLFPTSKLDHNLVAN